MEKPTAIPWWNRTTARPGSRPTGLADGNDLEFPGGAAGLEFEFVAGSLAGEFHADGGFRRDDEDIFHFDAAAFGAEEIPHGLAVRFEFDERGHIDGSLAGKLREFERLIGRERFLGG